MKKYILSGLLALAVAVSAAPAMAQNLAFKLINESSYDLHYFYTTPSSASDWGYDLLGDNGVLQSGYNATVTIGDGSDQCLYDFKFVIADGTETVINKINICKLSSYTLHD